jgi:hypothetical protein
MFTKRIWLLIGALTILSASVVGVSAYFTKKTISKVGVLEREIIEEATTIKEESASIDLENEITTTEIEEPTILEPEELTSIESEEIIPNPRIDTLDWKIYKNTEYLEKNTIQNSFWQTATWDDAINEERPIYNLRNYDNYADKEKRGEDCFDIL